MFEWWHWMVLGLSLTIAELVVPAFFIVWFGIGALAVGLVLLILPELGVPAQILLWAGFSSALVVLWFRYLKPKTMTTAGTSASDAIGEIGILVSNLSPHSRGKIRFQKPVLGSDVWECYADTSIQAGERARIVAVEGNYIKVEENK